MTYGTLQLADNCHDFCHHYSALFPNLKAICIISAILSAQTETLISYHQMCILNCSSRFFVLVMEINSYLEYLFYDRTYHSLDPSAVAWNFTCQLQLKPAGGELLKWAFDVLNNNILIFLNSNFNYDIYQSYH